MARIVIVRQRRDNSFIDNSKVVFTVGIDLGGRNHARYRVAGYSRLSTHPVSLENSAANEYLPLGNGSERPRSGRIDDLRGYWWKTRSRVWQNQLRSLVFECVDVMPRVRVIYGKKSGLLYTEAEEYCTPRHSLNIMYF